MNRSSFAAALAAGGLAGALMPAAAVPQVSGGRIDVHHHFAPPEWLALMKAQNPENAGFWSNWSVAKSLDQMDTNGTQKAMLSLTTPGISFGDGPGARRIVRSSNEYAAKLATDHPGRFGRFVALPLPDIAGSLEEIAYGLDTLKADGVGVFTSYGDIWFGDPAFAPVYEELNRRSALVFVHPLSPKCCTNLVTGIVDADIEYGADTTRAIARTVFSGTSTRYPKMRIIWSHGGGTMPFLAWRFLREAAKGPNKAMFPDGFLPEARRFYYDTAQVANLMPMSALSKMVPLSHILFGSDYPFLTLKENIDGLNGCGVFDAAQLAAINRSNVVALLGK